MAANKLVQEGVVICGYLIKECQHILERRNKRKKTTVGQAVDSET
jgi:predicted nucleic acid-binding Zn ribbon protein